MTATRELLVLLIEDEDADALLVRRRLKELPDPTVGTLERVDTLRDGLDRIGKGGVDVVLLDLNLPDAAGVETVRRLRQADPEVPLVVFTVLGDESTALEALEAGAQDYLVKGELTASLLHRSLRYAVERVRIQRRNQELQSHLEQARRLESLTALALGLCWAMKREATTIEEAVDAILAEQRKGRKSPEARLREIRRSTQVLDELTRGLEHFAGGSPRRTQRVDLSALVTEISGFLEALVRDQSELVLDLGSKLPPIAADPAGLRHALATLVVNAAEAGAGDHGIAVRTGLRTLDRRALTQGCVGVDLGEGEYLCLEVSDRGEVISPDAMSRLFEPSFTREEAGRRLGMAAVLGIVRGHGGAIKVESEPGAPTTFTILLRPITE